MTVKMFFRNLAIAVLIVLSPFLLFLLVVIVDHAYSSPPPSDDEMIAVLSERRATFDALIAKVSESNTTGYISIYKRRGEMKNSDSWAAEMRGLMRVAGVNKIFYHGPGLVIKLIYSSRPMR